MPRRIRSVVVPLFSLLLATHQTLCGPYFRDTPALKCFACYTFVTLMRSYASLAILWRLSCLIGRWCLCLGSVLILIGLSLLNSVPSRPYLVPHWLNSAASLLYLRYLGSGLSQNGNGYVLYIRRVKLDACCLSQNGHI